MQNYDLLRMVTEYKTEEKVSGDYIENLLVSVAAKNRSS